MLALHLPNELMVGSEEDGGFGGASLKVQEKGRGDPMKSREASKMPSKDCEKIG